MPAILLIPYVAVAGLQASDRLADSFIGAGTILLTYLMLREAARRRLLAITPATGAALAVLLGLGTVHFYLSVMGEVWFLSQITATFFLTLAVWMILRNDRGARWTAAAGVAFGCALLARVSLLTTTPFFAVAMIAGGAWSRSLGWRRASRHALAFAIPVAAALATLLWYNYARFGSPFDDGVRTQTVTGANLRFKEAYEKNGFFSLHYVPHNAYYYFLNPTLLRHPETGALTFDPEGNSMFLVTPAFLLVFRSFRRRNWLVGAAAAGSLLCLGTLLCFFGTGWFNFGNRYLLDLMPLAILLMAAGLGPRLTPVSIALIVLSVLVNAWGTYRFAIEQS